LCHPGPDQVNKAKIYKEVSNFLPLPLSEGGWVGIIMFSGRVAEWQSGRAREGLGA